MIWSNDLKFLGARVRQQKQHISDIMQAFIEKKISLTRSLEVIKSAMGQHSYFEKKVLHRIEELFPVGSEVVFINWPGVRCVPWIVREIFLSDGNVHLKDGDDNQSTTIPIEHPECIYDHIRIVER